MKSRREQVRTALSKASGATPLEVRHLVDAVPALMAEASRRAAERPDLASTLAARSLWAVPRLAVATAVAVVLASIALFIGNGAATPGATTLDNVILDGASGPNGETGDVLLDAVLEAGRNDG